MIVGRDGFPEEAPVRVPLHSLLHHRKELSGDGPCSSVSLSTDPCLNSEHFQFVGEWPRNDERSQLTDPMQNL